MIRLVRARRFLFSPLDRFAERHLGPSSEETKKMLEGLNVTSMNELTEKALPESVFKNSSFHYKSSIQPLKDVQKEGITISNYRSNEYSESQVLSLLKRIAGLNIVKKSYIGQGYYGTLTPQVILRNILENPLWYTQYTPYQPEISQGRLESLLNYQTLVKDLTAMNISNASLLDEATAAAEAMMLCYTSSKDKSKNVFLVKNGVFDQTYACLKSRAEPFGIEVLKVDDIEKSLNSKVFGVALQYPDVNGEIYKDLQNLTSKIHSFGAKACCGTDLLALCVLHPPGELGFDIAYGNAQRFGVPLGYGGPHAAFFAVKDDLKRKIPGRLVGVSKDSLGNRAYRLTLQTREQHIRREKATSNICTAQALLANISAMYAIYHGPHGLKEIAIRVHSITSMVNQGLQQLGLKTSPHDFFDTLVVEVKEGFSEYAEQNGVNVRNISSSRIGISIDESVNFEDVKKLMGLFAQYHGKQISVDKMQLKVTIPDDLQRKSKILQHEVFNSYHSETEILRYITRLQAKDLSLGHAMIPLGSCTMKLNATTEMVPVTWPEFNLHPFVPKTQTKGYDLLFEDLKRDLCDLTGFDDISFQPNSGAQGEYAGLRLIRSYLRSKGDQHRNICLIPVSAHGTNPASAQMAGMQVVALKCLPSGNLDLEDLKSKISLHSKELACIMITYPSTFGFYDEGVEEICKRVHDVGAQVYMDGANFNAQVGLIRPGEYGPDVCHLNLHKTFCIPHGGGGPGMGPIGVKSHLAPFLPGHPIIKTGGSEAIDAISAAPYGSSSILPISWSYIKMMGLRGLQKATEIAILNANYMAKRLSSHYKILYTNKNGFCAHEFIVDARPFTQYGIEAVDIAKRLQDYGFHSPTMSWPVTNTLMIEPTESESLSEIDRFCDAMISIRKEIQEVIDGKYAKDDNVLVNAPHSLEMLLGEWKKPYSREVAGFPMKWLKPSGNGKLWPSCGRLDDSYGDKNLFCECPKVEE